MELFREWVSNKWGGFVFCFSRKSLYFCHFIFFCIVKKEKTKRKKIKKKSIKSKSSKKKKEKKWNKKKKKETPRRSACYGHRKHKSFIESKHIFWKQETDAKILFSWINEIRMDEFVELMKEHNWETLGLFV